jgi:predicted dehydrogenase
MLLPAFRGIRGVEFVGVCTGNGSHARRAGEKFGFRYCATDEQKILDDPEVNAVVIATRHHLHGRQVLAGIEAGKHVFCEKPLCLTEIELGEIVHAYESRIPGHNRVLTVGFNRRFAPMAIKMKAFLKQVREPLALHYRVNAGFVSRDHWVNDIEQGGGRILGEVCHFVDFLTFLAEALPIEVQAHSLSCRRLDRHDHLCGEWRPSLLEGTRRGIWRGLGCGTRRFSESGTCASWPKADIPLQIPAGQRSSR